MRDLGAMGESTFSLWCSQAGLIHNGSRVDRTGWDFYVEFPSPSTLRADELHTPALECKVQVKSSDKRDRKLQIRLSNLRRLITAQMPAFIVFLEFDKAETAQRAYIVHIDSVMIERTLKRIHEIEQLEGRSDHNKRTLTVTYGAEHQLSPLNGTALKSKLESFAPVGMAEYVARKKTLLDSTGFENGFATFTFQTEGEQNVRDLIDVSIGVRKSAEIKSFRGFHTRFGINSRSPMLEATGGHLEMPDLKPTARGVVRFREDRLSPALCFECRLFVSPLAALVPRRLAKMRVEGDCFDLKFSPFTGDAEYKFDVGAGASLPLPRLRDTVRLLYLITSSSKRLLAELAFDGYPPIELSINSLSEPFDLLKEMHALECATDILYRFGAPDTTQASLQDISRNRDSISQFHRVLTEKDCLYKVEFGVEGSGFDSSKRVACISMTTVQIGTLVLGLILVLTGNVTNLPDSKYQLITSGATIERKLVSDSRGTIPKEDLVAAIELVEKKYDANFEVVTMYDKA